MRKAYSQQRRLDAQSVLDVQLNFECRDEICCPPIEMTPSFTE